MRKRNVEREKKKAAVPNPMHTTQLRMRNLSTSTGRRFMERVGRMIILKVSQRAFRKELLPTNSISASVGTSTSKLSFPNWR